MPIFGDGRLSWLLGIEDTCVYPADDPGSENPAGVLDEHVLTEHSVRWRDDFRLARRARCDSRALWRELAGRARDRASVEWGVLDEVVEFAEQLGLRLVADLVHYGTPSWLPGSFADPGYPDAVAEFAGAFATRYRGRVRHYTPLNEPVTTASFCGLRGVWPPRLTGWPGWVAVVVPVVEGMARTTRAIRAADPDAVIVHVEAATSITTDDPCLEDHAELLRGVGWLPTDLLLGRVGADHPMRAWLIEQGADEQRLEALLADPAVPDVVGVNYYPDLTPRRLVSSGDDILQVSYNRGALGLREAVLAFRDRYRLPLAITETSIEGTDAVRGGWLRDSVAEVARLRAEGVDLRGYTWWPLFDFVDWSWAAGGANVEEFVVALPAGDSVELAPAPSLGDPRAGKSAFLRRMGLVRLEERDDGALDRVPTSAASEFTRLSSAASPERSPG